MRRTGVPTQTSKIFFDLLKRFHKPTPLWWVYLLLLMGFTVVFLRVVVVPYIHVPGSVTLAWDPSPTPCPDKFGYNVYRAEQSGVYPAKPVNTEPVKEPTYTDTSVLSGQTYYYVVKARCGNSESGPSNEMKVDIPYKRFR